MNIRGDMCRGSSGGGADQLRPTEDEADCCHSLPDNRMPSRSNSASLTKSSPPRIHIGNSISRQVTFSKRRTAIFKKAYELSALCEADVAVIIFSSTNRMYEYASSSMLDILERYRGYKSIDLPSTEQKTDHLLLQQDGETWRREALYLQQRIKHLTDVQSYMMGENMSSLSLHELQTVESNLGVALNRISARKMELLQLDSQTLSQKESFSHLREENELLKRKVAELTARSSDPGETSSTIGTACSGATPEFNAMTSCRAAHDDLTLKLGL